MKTLLVPVTLHDTLPSVFETTRLVAQRFGSLIEGVSLRPALAEYVPVDMVGGMTWLRDEEADRVFRALADATRRDILRRAIREEQSVSGLSRRYAMTFAAVQKHVAVLERAALVVKERRGREQIVHANRRTVQEAASVLAAFEQLWIDRATRIGDVLADDEGSTA